MVGIIRLIQNVTGNYYLSSPAGEVEEVIDMIRSCRAQFSSVKVNSEAGGLGISEDPEF